MQCSRCGQALPPTARFCPTCGTTTAAAPVPPADITAMAPDAGGHVEVGRRSVVPFVMTAIVFAALVAGGIAVIGTRDTGDTGDTAAGGRAGGTVAASTTTTADSAAATPPTTSTTPAAADTTAQPASTTTTSTTTTTTTTIPQDANAVALTELAATIDADRPRVDAHLDRWVPQLSAKRAGTRWEGVDYGLPEIIGLHRMLDAQYGTLLVSGADYNFRIDERPMAEWFITIVDQSHPTPDGALEWCRANGIDRDNCAAKLITNSQDTGRTLVLQ